MSLPASATGSLISAAADAQTIRIDALAPPGGVLIVAPHPDDETFGCGEALAAAAEAGRKIGIVLLTDGEGSHPRSLLFDRNRLIATRTHEMRTALAILAPDATIAIIRVGLLDGRSRLSALSNVGLQRILSFAAMLGTRSVWSAWRGDPHCDHKTAAALAHLIARESDSHLWQFPIWGRFGDRNVPVGLRVFADRRFERRKREAIAAYRSQTTSLIGDDPDGFVMPSRFVEYFGQNAEIFIGG